MLKVIDIFVTESYIIIVGSAKCRLFLFKKRHRTKTCGVFPATNAIIDTGCIGLQFRILCATIN